VLDQSHSVGDFAKPPDRIRIDVIRNGRDRLLPHDIPIILAARLPESRFPPLGGGGAGHCRSPAKAGRLRIARGSGTTRYFVAKLAGLASNPLDYPDASQSDEAGPPATIHPGVPVAGRSIHPAFK